MVTEVFLRCSKEKSDAGEPSADKKKKEEKEEERVEDVSVFFCVLVYLCSLAGVNCINELPHSKTLTRRHWRKR